MPENPPPEPTLICQGCGTDLRVAQCGDTCPACGEPIVLDDEAE